MINSFDVFVIKGFTVYTAANQETYSFHIKPETRKHMAFIYTASNRKTIAFIYNRKPRNDSFNIQPETGKHIAFIYTRKPENK